MNDSDPIVDEVRRIRDAHAAKFNYDLKAIFRDIKEKEKNSGRKYVSFADAASEIVPTQALQPTGATISVSPDVSSQGQPT
jgi:CRISPR/Cas system CMR-associated protein Cmr5 small subunit